MKTGVEYLHSNEKRAVDLIFTSALVPIELVTTSIAKLAFTGFDSVYFDQLRVGKGNEPTIIRKLRTLDENGSPINRLAEIYRNKGIDELPQLKMIRDGSMSIFGSRPLIPEEYDQVTSYAKKTNHGRNLLDKHMDIVVPAKKGLLSRFGFMGHTQNFDTNSLVRLEMDICDHEQASTIYDLQTLTIYIGKLVKNELTKGKV